MLRRCQWAVSTGGVRINSQSRQRDRLATGVGFRGKAGRIAAGGRSLGIGGRVVVYRRETQRSPVTVERVAGLPEMAYKSPICHFDAYISPPLLLLSSSILKQGLAYKFPLCLAQRPNLPPFLRLSHTLQHASPPILTSTSSTAVFPYGD